MSTTAAGLTVRCPKCKVILKLMKAPASGVVKCPKCETSVPVKEEAAGGKSSAETKAERPAAKTAAVKKPAAAEEAPKKSKKKKSGKSSKPAGHQIGIWLGVGAGAFVILMIALAFIMMPRRSPLHDAVAEDLYPAQWSVAVSLKPKTVFASSLLKAVPQNETKQLDDMTKDFKTMASIDPKDCDNLYFFSDETEKVTFLATPSESIDIKAATKGKKPTETHKKVAIYKLDSAKQAMYYTIANPKLLFGSTDIEVLRSAIDDHIAGNPTNPLNLPSAEIALTVRNLDKMMTAAQGKLPRSGAGFVPPKVTGLPQPAANTAKPQPSAPGGLAMMTDPSAMLNQARDKLKDVTSITLSAWVSNGLKVNAAVETKDNPTAAQFAKELNGLRAQGAALLALMSLGKDVPPGVKTAGEVLKNEVKSSGARLSFEFSIDAQSLAALTGGGGAAPGAGPGAAIAGGPGAIPTGPGGPAGPGGLPGGLAVGPGGAPNLAPGGPGGPGGAIRPAGPGVAGAPGVPAGPGGVRPFGGPTEPPGAVLPGNGPGPGAAAQPGVAGANGGPLVPGNPGGPAGRGPMPPAGVPGAGAGAAAPGGVPPAAGPGAGAGRDPRAEKGDKDDPKDKNKKKKTKKGRLFNNN